MRRRSVAAAPLWAAGITAPGSAAALDKQGSAHGGLIGSDDRAFNVSGALMLGVAPYNPSYAARPDNSGLALLRYGGHLDVDLIGRYLSIPIDVSFFSDAKRSGLAVVAPSAFDVIAGVTSTFGAGPGDLEVGVRVEHDRPVDRGDFTQTYVDARGRYLFSLANALPGLGEALQEGDVSGWVTLGGFVVNPTYAARPDNTGKALLRYAAHAEVSTFADLVSLALDTTFFTDRERSAFGPSELDLTVDLILHRAPFELHVAYERDMPIDQGGFVQQFVYLLAVWNFDLRDVITRPLGARTGVPSP